MKTILAVLFLLVCFGSSQNLQAMSISIGQTYVAGFQDAYALQCVGAVGTISYQVEGLPIGTSLQSNVIVVGKETAAGNYVLKIQAVDQVGNRVQKVVSLSVTDQVQASTGSSSTKSTTSTSTSSASSKPATSSSSSSSSSTTTSSSARLDALINQHSSSSITDIASSLNYFSSNSNNNRYPETNFPTAGDSTAINTEITKIVSQQATPSAANRNQITAEDVSLKAASQRHQNAIKAITNLISIIDQGRANKNAAYASINQYTLDIKSAKQTQRSTQDNIIAIQTKIQQISSAVNGLTNGNDNLQIRIDALLQEKRTLVVRNQQLNQLISGQTTKKNGLQAQLDQINREIAAQRAALAQKQTECQNLKTEISRVQGQLSNLRAQVAKLEAQTNSAQKDLENKQRIVDDLEKKLSEAKISRDVARDLVNTLTTQRNSLLPQIDTFVAQLAELKQKMLNCEAQTTQLKARIDELLQALSNLQKAIDEINAIIVVYQRELDKNVLRIGEIDGTLPSLENNKASSLDDLSYLRQQLVLAQEQLRKAHQAGNDANTAVLFAQQNLDAATLRYNKQSENVSTATLNLEKARAEEALARLALQESIAHYTDAFPYAIVPNGNGQTPAGTPSGNNPSGSAMGPVNSNNDGALGSFVISDWTYSLSQAFGAGVNPAYPGSVTRIFPFNFFSTVSGNNVNNNYNGLRSASASDNTGICSGSGPIRSTTGNIIAVSQNSFDLKLNDGSIMHINVAPCTQMNANQPRYSMVAGNVAVVKGIQSSGNSLNGQSVMCLA